MGKRQLTISSNNLFHFTKKFENIVSILEFEFRPHYCLENHNFSFGDGTIQIDDFILAFPMVCFCDIPLSQTKDHMKTYGEYGIGLSKKWGIENMVSPVLYIHNKSKVFNMIKKIGGIVYEKHKGGIIDSESKNIIFGYLHEIYGMIKPYEGKWWRNERYTNNLRFYDEREWRFVPEDAYGYGIPKEIFLDKVKLKSFNDEIWEKVVIPFKPSDIKYIIVKKESQIINIIQKIERINKYSPDEKKMLCSRVISAEQIYEDF